jgi:hypothetical protein
MEIIWLGIGFLVGMALWMPFLIDARLGARLARIRGVAGAV